MFSSFLNHGEFLLFSELKVSALSGFAHITERLFIWQYDLRVIASTSLYLSYNSKII